LRDTGADIDISVVNPNNNPQILVGRDYYSNTQKPGYVPYPYPHPITLVSSVNIPPGGGGGNPAPNPNPGGNNPGGNGGGGGGGVNTTPTVTTTLPRTTASTTSISKTLTPLGQFVELLIALGVIAPNKIDLARAYVASQSIQTTKNIQPTPKPKTPITTPKPVTTTKATTSTKTSTTTKTTTQTTSATQNSTVQTTLSRRLSLGSSGPDVSLLQTLLTKHGYTTPITGTFDETTRLSLSKFQKDNNILPAEGSMGAVTAKRLTER
jgi:hypothetical protein